MNRKSRIFSFLLAMIFLFSLSACGEVKKKAPAKKVDVEKTSVSDSDKKKPKKLTGKKDEKKVADSKNKKSEGKEKKTETKTETKTESNTGSKTNKNEGGEKGTVKETSKKKESSSSKEDEDVIEITEKLFLQKINDIYFNFEDYRGSTIAVEGMFSHFQNMDGTEQRPVVYRNGPGCCGNDGWGGFFLIYDGDFPKENDWIRVTGKPIVVESKQGWLELFLKVESLEVKEERGAEFVTH